MKSCKESVTSAYHLLKSALFSIVGVTALILSCQCVGIDVWHCLLFGGVTVLCLVLAYIRLDAFCTEKDISYPFEDMGITGTIALCITSIVLDTLCLVATVNGLYDPADLVHLIFYSAFSTLFAVSIVEDCYILSSSLYHKYHHVQVDL